VRGTVCLRGFQVNRKNSFSFIIAVAIARLAAAAVPFADHVYVLNHWR
jgi:hypothetical protein